MLPVRSQGLSLEVGGHGVVSHVGRGCCGRHLTIPETWPWATDLRQAFTAFTVICALLPP
jgi:hypothetical protein